MSEYAIDLTNPAQLAALHDAFGQYQDWRKHVLSSCREAVRAEMTLKEERCSESRLDDLAHVHPTYVAFLTKGLEERIAFEQMKRASIGL
jgi:hypothetical protein